MLVFAPPRVCTRLGNGRIELGVSQKLCAPPSPALVCACAASGMHGLYGPAAQNLGYQG